MATAVALALAALPACFCSSIGAQAQPKAPAQGAGPAHGGQEYHIEVNTLPGCFFAGCTQRVSAANIAVSAGGVRVPARVAQPVRSASAAQAVPVHLLVAFAPGSSRPADAELLLDLKRALAAGWLVSVCRGDGTFTPYGREADLRQELAQSAAGASQDAGLDTISGAIKELRAQPGYRVIVADLSGRSDDKFARWLASEADRLSPIYVSDGGKAQMPNSPTAGGGSGAAWMGDGTAKRERAYVDGVFHEMKLGEAIGDAMADSRFEYDVRFRAPAGTDVDAPVKLTFLDPGTHLPYELRTDLYTVETQEVGGKPVKLRADATTRLKTVER